MATANPSLFIFHYSLKYILSSLCAVAIAVLSLFPVKELHLEDMTLSDKWAHFIMYGGFMATILFDRMYRQRNFRMPIPILLFPIAYGGLMELLQAYCTNGNRSGDWLDFAENSIGAFLVYTTALIIKSNYHKP